MLDFMWHLRGSVCLNNIDSDAAVLDRVEGLLSKQGKPVIERGAEHLTFNDPLWRNPLGPNWLALVFYDRGRFWIARDPHGRELRYDLRSLHGMIFCLFAAVTAFLFGVFGGGLSQGLKYAGVAFAWLYGVNILLAFFRVPSVIHESVVDP
jgi:hypothetical protein